MHYSDNHLLKNDCICALLSAECIFTVGMIFFGRTNFTKLSSSLKLLCSLYGTPIKLDIMNSYIRTKSLTLTFESLNHSDHFPDQWLMVCSTEVHFAWADHLLYVHTINCNISSLGRFNHGQIFSLCTMFPSSGLKGQ